MEGSVGWTFSRLTICLLNLKRTQSNRVVQVLTGTAIYSGTRKRADRAESSLCPKCSLEVETPTHHVGNCKLYQDIRINILESPKSLLTTWQRNVTLTNWPST